MIYYEDLNEKFITDRFPELTEKVNKETEGYEEFLSHVVFGNIFNPLTVSLLKSDDFSTDQLLKRIFEMYEEMSSEGDAEVRNLVEATLLEYLWDEKKTYDRALKMMGEKTKELWGDINYLSVPEE